MNDADTTTKKINKKGIEKEDTNPLTPEPTSETVSMVSRVLNAGSVSSDTNIAQSEGNVNQEGENDVETVQNDSEYYRSDSYKLASNVMYNVLDKGKSIDLGADTLLKKASINGENVIEIVGQNAESLAVSNPAIYSETANDTERFFLNADDTGLKTLSKILPSEDSAKFKNMPVTSNTPAKKSVKTKPITQIIREMSMTFETPITRGYVGVKDAEGIFKGKAESIRIKNANDIETVCHEVGHFIDKKFKFTKNLDSAVSRELVSGINELNKGFLELYPESKHNSEAFAEFIWEYMKDYEFAKTKFPLTFNALSEKIDTKTMKSVNRFANDVNNYIAYSNEDGARLSISHEDAMPNFSVKEKFAKFRRDFSYNMRDSNAAIREFADFAENQDIYRIATNNLGISKKINGAMTQKVTDLNGEIVCDSIYDILSPLRAKANRKNGSFKEQTADFNDYLLAKHAPERLALNKQVSAVPAHNTIAYNENRVLELEAKYPYFNKMANDVYSYIDAIMVNYGIKSGLMSQADYDSMKSFYKYYVPFYRYVPRDVFGNTVNTKAKKSVANFNNPVKRARGGGDLVYNPIENILTLTENMMTSGSGNALGLKIADLANATDGSAKFLEKVDPKNIPTFVDLSAEKDKVIKAIERLTASQNDYWNDPNFIDLANSLTDTIDSSIENTLVIYEQEQAHGDIITFRRDGKPEHYKVNDPILLDSLKGSDLGRMDSVLKSWSKLTRFVSANLTGRNIVWSVRSNFIRDIATALYYTSPKDYLTFAKGFALSYVNSAKALTSKNSNLYWDEFMANGGVGMSAVDIADPKRLTKISKKLNGGSLLDLVNPLTTIEFLSDTIERGPRFATYYIARHKHNLSVNEAMYLANDITTNFSKSGKVSKSIASVIPFFNSSVQGLSKYYDYLSARDIPKAKRKAMSMQRVSLSILSLAMMGLAQYLYNNRDEESKQASQMLSNYTKNTNFFFYKGDGEFFTIPKARELHVGASFFYSLFDKTYGENEKAFDDFYSYATDNFLPPGVSELAQGDLWGIGTAPSGLGTVVSLAVNRDFLGRDIEKDADKYNKQDLYDGQNTVAAIYASKKLSEFSKAIGIPQSFINEYGFSPAQLDFIASDTLGFVQEFNSALGASDPTMRDKTLGFSRSYFKNILYSNNVVSDLYDQKENALKAKNSNPEVSKYATDYDSYYVMMNFYSAYNKLYNAESEDVRSNSDRLEVLNILSNFEEQMKTDSHSDVYEYLASFEDVDIMPNYKTPNFSYRDRNSNWQKVELNSSEYLTYQKDYWESFANYADKVKEYEKDNNAPKETVLKLLGDIDSYAKNEAQEKVLLRLGVK